MSLSGRTLLIFLTLLLTTPALAAPVARTTAGTLQGKQEGTAAEYLGIPYAAPPVGPNRWRAPQPVKPWPGTRDATTFGASCWQAVSSEGFGPWSHEYVVNGSISEDCLFLNVWSPTKASGKLPVLVWIHGGGFNSGSGAIPIYNGRSVAERGIVVVTINYRVGVFGFLAHPELTAEAKGSPPANFGLQDMIAALRWIRSNIEAFHGDPDAVTIAGQSAGSMAVHDLIASPMARGLFQRAIAESGLPGTRPAPALAVAEQDGAAFAKEKGAAGLAELRSLPAEALQPGKGGNSIRFVPVVDGAVLTEDPAAAIQAGRAADVPMIAGFTADEGSALGQNYASSDPAQLDALLLETFGSRAEDARSLYAASTPEERTASNILIRRDRGLAALDRLGRARAGTGRAPSYFYLFSHVQPGRDAAKWRAFHSSEIPYVFGTLDAAPERGFTAADRTLSRRVQTYWINFVKSGDPNGPGKAPWPAFQPSDPQILEIGDSIRSRRLLSPKTLKLFEELDASGKTSIF